MISRLLFALQKAVLYVKDHPQLLFALMLLVVIPLLFLYTGQQFLDVGKANQDTLQKERVGLMQDTLSSLLTATDYDLVVIDSELRRIAELNPDITQYVIAEHIGGDIIPVVAKDAQRIGVPETNTNLYRNASLRTDESIIFEQYKGEARIWDVYRAVEGTEGVMYFIYTEVSLEKIDALFRSREQAAYFSLLFVYLFVIALAYWHIRLTDYRYLYMKAQKANQMKDMFTNMIAHELRAPLTAIKGYASMLDEKLTDSVQKQHASRIKESSERLIAIVNDLLDVARIQSGKLSVQNEQVDVTKILTAVTDELKVSASEKNIQLKIEGAQVSVSALADPKRLHQAMTNLVSNAIKYTEAGAITLYLEEKHAFVEIRVKDTGMGISSEDQKKLFAPFFRVATADVSRITGTGLGMWITKELIELMGAKIGVESIKGVGTQIVVTIPRAIRIS